MTSSIVFTKSAAARILGVSARQISKLEVFANTVIVFMKGQEAYSLEHREFQQSFADYRKEEGKAIALQRNVFKVGEEYLVKASTPTASHYMVRMENHAPICECGDYVRQKEIWGRGVCKHGYAVLSTLGYKSLRDAIAA